GELEMAALRRPAPAGARAAVGEFHGAEYARTSLQLHRRPGAARQGVSPSLSLAATRSRRSLLLWKLARELRERVPCRREFTMDRGHHVRGITQFTRLG